MFFLFFVLFINSDFPETAVSMHTCMHRANDLTSPTCRFNRSKHTRMVSNSLFPPLQYCLLSVTVTMSGRSAISRTGGFRPENLGQNALSLIGNIGFSIFVIGVIVFTIIAATYEPEDPLFHPSNKITTFLTSTRSNATLKSDDSVVKTGEDFIEPANQTEFSGFIEISDVETPEINSEANQLDCDTNLPIDCKDPEIFHLMMKATIEKFKDIHFYKFGKPVSVEGTNTSSCDMAWRYRPKDGKSAAFYKDYRRFVIEKSVNCSVSVMGIGEYHSGVNARKRKKNQKPGFEKSTVKVDDFSLPVVGEVVNDSLPVVESENAFKTVTTWFMLVEEIGARV